MEKILMISIILGSLLLAGCSRQMTNQEIVEQTKYCEENGLDTQVIYITNIISEVRCFPKNSINNK